jgi:hypothetical protein
LTEAGSLFLLQPANDVSEDVGKKLIEDWLAHGLPLKGAVLDYYQIDKDESRQWQNCPFIPQNGYGEIAVNLQLDISKPVQITPIQVLQGKE